MSHGMADRAEVLIVALSGETLGTPRSGHWGAIRSRPPPVNSVAAGNRSGFRYRGQTVWAFGAYASRFLAHGCRDRRTLLSFSPSVAPANGASAPYPRRMLLRVLLEV